MALNKDPKSGKWIAQIGSGDQGTRKTKRFKYKREAQAWIREQESYFESEESGFAFGPDTKIDEPISLYLKSVEHRTAHYKREVRVSLQSVIKTCRIQTLGDITPKRLTPYKIRDDLNPRTINKHIGFVKSMCRFLESEGWISRSPVSGMKTISSIKPEKRALTQNETEELLRAAYANSPDIWFPIIFIGLRLALRKAELLTLEWTDIRDVP